MGLIKLSSFMRLEIINMCIYIYGYCTERQLASVTPLSCEEVGHAQNPCGCVQSDSWRRCPRCLAEQLAGRVTAVCNARKKPLFLLQSDDDMFFSDRSARDVITFFLFGLLRCPTQSSLNCLHQDSVSITYKMIRQLQLCLVWLVCSGR